MEEKSSSWVFTLLSARSEAIPILDTIIFQDNKPLKFLSNKQNTEIQETESKPLPTIFSQLTSLDYPASKVICAFISNSSYKQIKKGEIRSSSLKLSKNLDQIQLLYTKKGLNLSSSLILEILFLSSRYKSQVFQKKSTFEKLENLENPFLKNSIKELGSVIVKAIESETTSQLLKLNLEFLMDFQENLYLQKVNSCVLVSSFWTQEVCSKSAEDLKKFLKTCKRVKTKSLFEKTTENDLHKEISVISIDSDEKDDGFLKVPEKNFTLRVSPSDPRNKRRTLSNCLKPVEVLKKNRKATFMPETNFHNNFNGSPDDHLDDSWDYGSVDVNFLEMISRRAIRNTNLSRPISPTYEEIKQKMRQINEKFSLTPSGIKTFDFRSDSLKFQLGGENIRKSIENRNEKISALGFPCLSRRKTSSKSMASLPNVCKFEIRKSWEKFN
jgi:hypothetical protein